MPARTVSDLEGEEEEGAVAAAAGPVLQAGPREEEQWHWLE